MIAPMPRLSVKKAWPIAERTTSRRTAPKSKWNMKRSAAAMSAATMP